MGERSRTGNSSRQLRPGFPNPRRRTRPLIEVKGRRSCRTSVSVVDRQHNIAHTLGAYWWLYVVFDCSTPQPFLVIVEEPRRLPWRLLTIPRVIEPGKHVRIRDEGIWHVMPSDIISFGERVEICPEPP